MEKIRPLANSYSVIEHSDSPEDIYCYSPGILALPSGRLIATMDFGGPGVKRLPKSHPDALYPDFFLLGEVLVSDDGGEHWKVTTNYPFCHARPFLAGNSVYVLGQHGDLKIIRSDDGGDTWSEMFSLTEGELWHQAPSNVWYANG